MKRAALFRIVVACVAFPASASATTPLLWSEVDDDVEHLHPLLQAAVADVDAAAGDLLAAEGIFDAALALKAEGASGYYQNGSADAAIAMIAFGCM